jgi:toxin ParE1/3/4
MKFSFHAEAEIEFFEAIEYYESCRKNLGADFAFEVYSTINKIIVFPEAWMLVDTDIRRCIINRFPFGIIYSIEKDEIFILAVMHLHRKPDYWKNRVI